MTYKIISLTPGTPLTVESALARILSAEIEREIKSNLLTNFHLGAQKSYVY